MVASLHGPSVGDKDNQASGGWGGEGPGSRTYVLPVLHSMRLAYQGIDAGLGAGAGLASPAARAARELQSRRSAALAEEKRHLKLIREAAVGAPERGDGIVKVARAWASAGASHQGAGSTVLPEAVPHLQLGWGAPSACRHVRMLVLEGMLRDAADAATRASRSRHVRDRHSRSRSRLSRSRARLGQASSGPKKKDWRRSASAVPVERE